MWCPYGEGHAGVPGAGDRLLAPRAPTPTPWTTPSGRTLSPCKLRHPNIAALKATVNQEWAGMDEEFVFKVCQLSGSASDHRGRQRRVTSNEKI
ncbi:Uncharacterized protein FKW44_022469 [Caligus rogercresseyi]|uniref:Uncharacterized protein n=1 Tax=Caligus rogercresseyi TaxID=217165 RepID=A0A7T8JTJ3_CALRO|nr:Uncharacterized protein FKW44_022469 [Caligus rogercresseyi]